MGASHFHGPAMSSTSQRACILSLLILVMAATRVNHFAAIPDASWAVFFIGGFYLARWTRWAFPLLMVFAVLVDWIVIRSTGIDFWQHYCVSPGYWLLLPAYFSLWAGGLLLGHNYHGAHWSVLAKGVPLLVVSVALCHLLAQGGFYWTSRNVAEPTLAGWARNYADWFGPYLRTTSLYVGLAAALQLACEQLVKLAHTRRELQH